MAAELQRTGPAGRRWAARLVPKAITEWNRTRIGVASILGMALVVATALLASSSVFASAYTVRARFANAVGLQAGDQVLLAGVAVGKVSSVQVVGDHVVADLAIDDGVEVPKDSSAQIAVQSLLGVIGVDILPGEQWQHLLGNGSVITNTSVPFEYFEVQNSAGHLLSSTDARALGEVVSDLDQATSGDKAQVHEIIDGLARATAAIDQHRNAAAQLIDAAEALSATLASKDRQLATVLDDLDLVMRGLASNSSQLGLLIDQTEATALQTSSLISRNQPRLSQMLDDLHKALSILGQHQLDIARSVAFAASAIKGFASVGKSGSASTPWANIFTNVLGAAAGYGVFGSCGALDQALDVALGPDPLPCNRRSGPPIGESGTRSGSASTPASSLVSPFVGGGS